MLRLPSVAGSSTVTCQFTSTTKSPRNVMQRHPFLYRLHAHTVRHVDFIGGDFNMSAFSTVGDVFTVPDFCSLWQCSPLGAVVVWTSFAKAALASSPCLSARTTWRVQAHGCSMFDDADLGFAPSDVSAHLPVFPVSQCHTQRPGPTPST